MPLDGEQRLVCSQLVSNKVFSRRFVKARAFRRRVYKSRGASLHHFLQPFVQVQLFVSVARSDLMAHIASGVTLPLSFIQF